MTLNCEAAVRRHLHAPRADFGRLIEPPLEVFDELVSRNAATQAAYDYDMQGRSINELAEQARGELVQSAWTYTRSYRDVPELKSDASSRVFLAGHQPQLFHPGVWFKNFVLGALAQRQGATAVNLVIDSDTIKTASLRVPTGTVRQPRIDNVPFDRPSAEIPYEQRRIVDRSVLESFGDRAANTVESVQPAPLVREFWPLVVDRSREIDNLGLCLAQARHQQEARWGLRTLELPQSGVCSLPAFYWFACHLLARLPALVEHYNLAVAEYRRANRIRSAHHPVPDLATDGEWLEAPFWVWDQQNPRRRRLFARQSGRQMQLSDRQGFETSIDLSPDVDASHAAEQLAELAGTGVVIRTRALITTLFARLMLGDVFLHGIGGAKYDQVTDTLIERFFGLKAPCFMTITATLRLGVDHDGATPDDARRVAGQLRELTFHPERYLDPQSDGQAATLVAAKQQRIGEVPTRTTARERCRAIRTLNEQLQPWVARSREQLDQERVEIAAGLRSESILSSRDYAFCLHPEDRLRRLMQVPSGGE